MDQGLIADYFKNQVLMVQTQDFLLIKQLKITLIKMGFKVETVVFQEP